MKHYLEQADAVLRDVDSRDSGLTAAEAEERLVKNGKNKLEEAKKDSLIKRFFQQMADPMIIILLAAGVLWLYFGHPAAGSGLVAVLTYGDDSTQLRIPLDTDHRYDIDTGYYTIHLVVENGGIRFVESPCPDHTCESFGVLTKQGDWAACLPARASVTVE